VVFQDGTLVGSIGGGVLEARVVTAAKGLMGRNAALVLEVLMTGKDVAGTDMICGGRVDVLVQGITYDHIQKYEVLKKIEEVIEKGREGVLVTGPLPDAGREANVDMLFYQHEAKRCGTIGGDEKLIEFIEQRARGILGSNTVCLVRYGPQGLPFVFDPLYSQPTVIIFGGGHISLHLAPLLTMVDFRVIVVDDRKAFANHERFPKVDQIVVTEFENCFEELELTSETFCVIVTRGHLHDKTVLENVINHPVQYVGMIGSRRKRNMIYEALKEQGISPERLKEVYAPIGLDIGAETPEAIAIAIAAELIKVRAKG